MDPYDAILDQLKRAQSRGLEAVGNRLDFVLETLDELIRDAKVSIQEAVPQDPEELFPVAEVERTVQELRSRLETAEREVADLRSGVAEAASAPAAQAGGLPLEWLRTLDAARSQSEVLRQLLPMLAEHVGRAVVLVLRGQAVSAWSGIGFTEGERLRSWQGQVEVSEALQRFVDDQRPVRFDAADDPMFSLWLAGEERAEEAMLLPVVLRGKLMGGIYVDRVAGGSWQPELVQELVAVVCLLIDTLHHRQQVPTPGFAEAVDLRAERPEAEGPAVVVEEPEGAPALPEEPEVPEEEPPAPVDHLPKLEPEPAAELGPEEIEEPEEIAAEAPEEATPADVAADDPSATMAVDAGVMPPPPETPEASPTEGIEEGGPPSVEAVPPPPEEAVLEEAEAAGVADEGPPPVQPVTPPPVEPVSPPESVPDAVGADLSPEEQTQHEEARRFARLLVSEIKLYNEEEVDRGRANGDLYSRLKEDIDRSREMFEKRIPPEVRAQRDYFHEELVRVLADGDEDALGM